MRKHRLTSLACLVGACAANDTSSVDHELHTSTNDGSEVNENHYADKDDVYLDGGPGANAPAHAAALAPGDYYFQVTDPSGKTVLSSDDVACRKFRINEDLVIDHLYASAGCTHDTGIDQDHDELGAITIGLAPFADSKNGVYKAWVTPVDKYDGGFVHRYSKTDNFKIGVADEEEAPTCGDGHVDSGEQCDDGNVANNDGCSSTCVIEECPHDCPDGSHD
jgi:cysteine-rich repeat protein